MITEEMIRVAAARSCEIYAAQLEKGFDPENQHVFSAEFEKRIKKLKRKADHPVFYRTMQRVALIILTILLAGGAWITVDAEAKAAFFGWVREIYETYVVYIFKTEAPDDVEAADYRPTWIPEGYTEFYFDDSEATVFVTYSNEAGQMMNFSYSHNPDETMWLVDRNNAVISQTVVNGRIAELFTSTSMDNASAMIWSTEDNTVFYLSAFLDDAELIRIAESVSPIK